MTDEQDGTAAAPFEVLDSVSHYRGWVIDVHTDTVRMPDGTSARRDVIDHRGAVGVVAIDDAERVVMVSQYRHPVRHELLELPAGLLDVDEEPALLAAQRELVEEAGVRAEQWSVLVDLYTSPGMTNEAIRVFLARGLTPVHDRDGFQAEGEELTMTVSWHRLDDLVSSALAGTLTNGPAVAGVLAAAAARALGWRNLRAAEAFWSARPGHAGELASEHPHTVERPGATR
jgi:8-oxo-dGTP pyrophosphatase MutT (NUDIX family)